MHYPRKLDYIYLPLGVNNEWGGGGGRWPLELYSQLFHLPCSSMSIFKNVFFVSSKIAAIRWENKNWGVNSIVVSVLWKISLYWIGMKLPSWDLLLILKMSHILWKNVTLSQASMPPQIPLLVCIKAWTTDQSGIYLGLLWTISFDKYDSFLLRGSRNYQKYSMLITLIINNPKAKIHVNQRQYPFGVNGSWWRQHVPRCFTCSFFNKDSFGPLQSVLHD